MTFTLEIHLLQGHLNPYSSSRVNAPWGKKCSCRVCFHVNPFKLPFGKHFRFQSKTICFIANWTFHLGNDIPLGSLGNSPTKKIMIFTTRSLYYCLFMLNCFDQDLHRINSSPDAFPEYCSVFCAPLGNSHSNSLTIKTETLSFSLPSRWNPRPPNGIVDLFKLLEQVSLHHRPSSPGSMAIVVQHHRGGQR